MPTAIYVNASVKLSVLFTSISVNAENNIIKNPHTVPIKPRVTKLSLLNHNTSRLNMVGFKMYPSTLIELTSQIARIRKLIFVLSAPHNDNHMSNM